ncbi:hypothetical protein D9M71_359050 [compost metagenome]
MLEVAQGEGAQLHVLLAAQQGFGALAMLGGNEGDRSLHGQAYLARTAVGGQPEFDFRPLGRVPPMPGQDEPLL